MHGINDHAEDVHFTYLLSSVIVIREQSVQKYL